MAVELGAGYVSLTIQAKDIGRQISQTIAGPVERAMSKLGATAGGEFSREFTDRARSGFSGLDFSRNLDTGFARSGTAAGNDFARNFQQQTKSGFTGLDVTGGLGAGFGRAGTDAGNDFARNFKEETRSLGGHTSRSFLDGSRGFGDSGTAGGASFAWVGC